MINKITLFLTALLFTIFLNSCNTNSNKDNDTNNDDTVENFDPNDPTLVKFNGKMFSIPSPIQIALLSKKLNIPFDINLLNKSNKYSKYSSGFKQALNLGVYGADLGYLNIYDQLPEAAQYFAVIKTMSTDLGVINTFSQETIERIEKNNNNKDSLVYILSTIYRDVDSYLLDNERNDVGVLILAGGWIESLYIMTQLNKQQKNQEIIDKIGEQKTPLKNLIELLKPFYGNETDTFDQFIEDLVDLSTAFNEIDREYIYKESTVDVEKKLTIINSETKTIITDKQLITITESILNIRNMVVE
jgi:hypothetical protein